MKTHFISLATCLAIIGSLTISCNSCDNKNNDPLPGATPPEARASDIGSSIDAASTGIAGEEEATSGNSSNGSGTTPRSSTSHSASAGSPNTMSTAVNKSRDVAGKGKTKSSKSGYSAPNGTDAENHDGDPYTKHDTTSMPTGTSIR